MENVNSVTDINKLLGLALHENVCFWLAKHCDFSVSTSKQDLQMLREEKMGLLGKLLDLL